MERLADLISQHQREQWPEAKINFGGHYPELTPEQRTADAELAKRIDAKQEIESQRYRWLDAFGSVLNDAYRYLLDGHTEAFQAFEKHPLWLVKQQRQEERDPKVWLDYLEKPILKDLESMKRLIASTGQRTRPGSTGRKTESHLTWRSVLLSMALEAHRQKQETAAAEIGMPQPHLSKLVNGKRAWTTKSLAQCAEYVRKSPPEGIAKVFFELAGREFRSS